MGVSFWQILIVAVVVLLIFGPKRIPGLGKALGEAIRGFRTGVKGEDGQPGEPQPGKNLEGAGKAVREPAAKSESAAPEAEISAKKKDPRFPKS